MMPAVFDQTTVDIEAKADRTYDFRVTGSVLKFDGFLKVWDGAGARRLRSLPELKRRRDAGESCRCSRSGTEVHAATAALQRSEPGEGAGRAGYRAAFDLCVDHQYDPGSRLREEDPGEVRAHGDWYRGDEAAGEEFSVHLRHRIYGEAGERAGCGRRGTTSAGPIC